MTAKASREQRARARKTVIRESLSEEQELAWFGLLETHERLVRAIDAELIAEHGLQLNVFETLVRIAHAPDGELSIADLAAHVRLSPSRTSRLVMQLERMGLVDRRRNPADARSTRAAITEKGIDRLREVTPTLLATTKRLFFDLLSEREVKQLGAIWKRVAGAATTSQGAD